MNEGANEEKKKMRKFTRKHKREKRREKQEGKKNLKVLHFIAQKKLFFSFLFFLCCILKQLEMFPSVPSGFFIYTCTVLIFFYLLLHKEGISNEN